MWIEHKGIFQELATEASKDEDLLLTHLGYSETLSACEALLLEADNFPVFLVLVIILLNDVDVLLCLIGDAAEDIDKSVLEAATCMIVSAFIQVWDLKPYIQIIVVLLTLLMRIVILLP
jgi:hypothetical protein